MAAKGSAPCILQHLHRQADLALHLGIRVHAAQVDPAVDAWWTDARTSVNSCAGLKSYQCQP
jgi:hypothetical protein